MPLTLAKQFYLVMIVQQTICNDGTECALSIYWNSLLSYLYWSIFLNSILYMLHTCGEKNQAML